MTAASTHRPRSPRSGTLGWLATGSRRVDLSDTSTVDRHLAHKVSPEQVFVTDVARDGDMLVALGALPTANRFFNDGAGTHHDPLLLAEFTRQALEVLSHALLEVPLDSRFVLRDVDVELVDPLAVPDQEPATVVVTLPQRQVRRNRRGTAYAASGPVGCCVAGRPTAVFGGTVAFMAAEAYDEVRAERGEPRIGVPSGSVQPLAPQTVGRQFRENVLISRPEGAAREATCLVVPTAHPAFFDRPLDHYPGMMIAEAARQLASVCVSQQQAAPIAEVWVERATMSFESFAELDPPLHLDVVAWTERQSGVEVTVVSRQGARITSRSRFRLAYGARPGAGS